jgi:hypothetical protein
MMDVATQTQTNTLVNHKDSKVNKAVVVVAEFPHQVFYLVVRVGRFKSRLLGPLSASQRTLGLPRLELLRGVSIISAADSISSKPLTLVIKKSCL